MPAITLPATSFIQPQWPAPSHIVALTSCRQGGASLPPFDSFNLAQHVNDDSAKVSINRQYLLEHCSGLQRIQWLEQVHGTDVITAQGDEVVTADASFTRQQGLACAVMTADCLPVLFCDQAGQQVAAAHAGWRSLVGGVLENTVKSFTVPASELFVWLGPAISQPYFEVGPEVRAAFLAADVVAVGSENHAAIETAFIENPDRPQHFFADLYQLARCRLQAAGVQYIYGGDHCSFREASDFYSYRRDGVTGRMVSLIYRQAVI